MTCGDAACVIANLRTHPDDAALAAPAGESSTVATQPGLAGALHVLWTELAGPVQAPTCRDVDKILRGREAGRHAGRATDQAICSSTRLAKALGLDRAAEGARATSRRGDRIAAAVCCAAQNGRDWHIAASDVCDGTSAVGESRHRIPGASVGQPTEPCLALPQRRSPGGGSSRDAPRCHGEGPAALPAPGRAGRSFTFASPSILRRALVLNGRTRPASTLVHCSDNRHKEATSVGYISPEPVRLNGNTFPAGSLPSATARRCADHASSAERFSSAQSCL